MHHVERAARNLEVWEEQANSSTSSKVSRMYEAIHSKFRILPRKRTPRFKAITWNRYLNMVKKNKGALVGDTVGGN